MMQEWEHRNPIVANLLNPAFCGEVIRVAADSYNKSTNTLFPYAYAFLILPIVLHKDTRDRMPKSVKAYLFAWIEDNEDLFFSFQIRAKDMVPFTKESLMFLLQNGVISLDESGGIEVPKKRQKKIKSDSMEEYDMIMKKSKLLGKWLSLNNNVNSVYSFLRITP